MPTSSARLALPSSAAGKSSPAADQKMQAVAHTTQIADRGLTSEPALLIRPYDKAFTVRPAPSTLSDIDSARLGPRDCKGRPNPSAASSYGFVDGEPRGTAG